MDLLLISATQRIHLVATVLARTADLAVAQTAVVEDEVVVLVTAVLEVLVVQVAPIRTMVAAEMEIKGAVRARVVAIQAAEARMLLLAEMASERVAGTKPDTDRSSIGTTCREEDRSNG